MHLRPTSHQTVLLHIRHTTSHGWTFPDLGSFSGDDQQHLIMKDLSSYWLRRPPSTSSHDLPSAKVTPNKDTDFFNEHLTNDSLLSSTTSVVTDLTIDGMILLTAPNMAGKSTLIRSVLAVTLLANCGLLVPCSYALVPRWTTHSHGIWFHINIYI